MRLLFFSLFFYCILLQGQPSKAIVLTEYEQAVFDSDTCCWRKLADEGRYNEGGQLILSYLDISQKITNPHALKWHAGQMFALAGNNRQAIKWFEKTYSIFYKWFGGQDGKAWYYYAKGTVAFLKRDKATLQKIIGHWDKQLPKDINYTSLTTLLEKWDKTYREATDSKRL